MLQLLNQHSYLITALLVFLIAGGFLLRWRGGLPGALLTLALTGLLVGGYFLLRPGQSTIQDAAEFEAALASGQPVLLELYSNY